MHRTMNALPKHMPALDGMRAIAIALVVLTHVSGGWSAALSIVKDTAGETAGFDIPRWLSRITEQSAHGVQLFFVVSAFTLTLALKRKHDSILAYAMRRIARIGPAYWLFGLYYTILAGTNPRLWAPNGLHLKDFVIAASFGSAWQGDASLAVVPGGWSVCCEAAFYVALPVVLFVVGRSIVRSILLLIASLVIVEVHFRHTAILRDPGFTFLVNPIQQLPVFLFGVTAALVSLKMKVPQQEKLAIGIISLAILTAPYIFSDVWGLRSQSYIIFAALIACAVALSASCEKGMLTNIKIGYIGKVSYSIYLIHFNTLSLSMWIVSDVIHLTDWKGLVLHFVITFAISFCIAIASYRYIEMPFIEWVARYQRRARVDKITESAAR